MEVDLSGLVLPERVEVLRRSEDGRAAQFVMAPLGRGFGQTLGNAARRILLSSLRGTAVWAFRMDGVVHEHQTVPGVVEDVHQIIQNLKTLVLALEEDKEEATLELRVTKAGPVTIRALEKSGAVTVVNEDHHLFTLNEDREVNLVLYVNRGRGFVPAEQHEIPKGSPVDLVRIDSIYNPVLRANFTVEETRVGQRTDFDRLTLLVETDGTLTPESAVAYAAELARKHLEYMLRFADGMAAEPPAREAVEVPEPLRELFKRPIEDLAELSMRSVNSLKKKKIVTVGDLVKRTEAEMLAIDNFGMKSLEEMRAFLEQHNLHFGMRLREGEDGNIFLMDVGEEANGGESAEGEEPVEAASGAEPEAAAAPEEEKA